jgi:tyrosine-protein phosphatase non-receptor type 9
MNICHRRLLQVSLVLTIFLVASSGKSNHSNQKTLKTLFYKIEHDKRILKKTDDLKRDLRSLNFLDERHKLRAGINGTFHHSELPENKYKNRYPATLCFDHSRVILSTDNDMSDYIHANFVDGYKQKRKFILTQGNPQIFHQNNSCYPHIFSLNFYKSKHSSAPLIKTCADFWRMIWEQRTLVITAVVEMVARKLDYEVVEYWGMHKGETKQFWDLSIETIKVEDHVDYILTKLILTNVKVQAVLDYELKLFSMKLHFQTNEIRKVTHLKMLNWNDFSVPPTSKAAIDFVIATRKIQKEMLKEIESSWTGYDWGPPIVCHCLGGYGRSG